MHRTRLFSLLALIATACYDGPVEPRARDTERSRLAAAVTPPACTKRWAGGIGGYWSDPSRWTPAGVPSITDDVCIEAPGTYDVTHTQHIMVQSLRIGGTGANVSFEFDPPSYGIGIMADDGLWIESGSTLTILSKGGVELIAGAGNLTIEGELDIENACACGGDVAVLDFEEIHNTGRMELEAPMTIVDGTEWTNHARSVVVTSGAGVIDSGRNLLDTSGTIAGATVIEVGLLFWRDGTIGTTGPVTSAVHITGGTLVLIGDTQDGRVDASTTPADFMLFMTESVSPNVAVDIRALMDDRVLILKTAPSSTPLAIDGTLSINANGHNVIVHDELLISGTLSITGTGSVEFLGDELVNQGMITTWGSDLFFTMPGSMLRNRGDMQSFSNSITLTMGPSTEFVAEAGGEVDASVALVLDDARLSGNGIVGDVTSSGGAIEPGAPYGTLTVDRLTLDAASELIVNVAGTSPGSYGRIDVKDDATYDGTFQLVSGSEPALGRCGDVITPIDHRGDPPAGAFSVWRGLKKGPKIAWRAQGTPDSLILAGYDPSSPTLTVSKSLASVSESGTTDQYSVCLGSATPKSSVTVVPESQNGQAVAPGAVTFDFATWRLPRMLTVAATDDAIVEPQHKDTVTYAFAGASVPYVGTAANHTPVTIADNDGDTDLQLVLQNAPATTLVGSVFEVVYRVTNHGPTLSTGATLRVDPQGATNATFQQAFGATCTVNGAGVLTCTVAGQAVGVQNTIAIVYQATAAGAIPFLASVVSQQPDSNAANNTALANVVVN